MPNHQIRAFSLSTAAALVLTALPAVSDARTIPGSIGRAAHPPDNICLPVGGALRNVCAHPVRVDFPLVVDTFGTITARVRARGPIECELSWWDGVTLRQSPTASLSVAGAPQLFSLTVNSSIPTDSVFIGCTLNQNAAVHTLIY
jgi:hypothetical protein